MSRASRCRVCFGAATVLALAVWLAGLLGGAPARATGERPFALPFAGPPGPSTWYVSQPYGNTVYAYYERRGLYRSGQGLHFGLDLAAACGTPVLAIGDGRVLSVDGRGGSPPHNLMIEHAGGLVSFYGHLMERPALVPGQTVLRGQPVALSGDMLGTCYSSPHLHLEIRDSSLTRLQNPVSLIEADWHRIMLLGPAGPVYSLNLDDPRRWQTLHDQPPVTLGGPLLNDVKNAWPRD